MRESDWTSRSIAFHRVPMKDFTGTTSVANIHGAVEFINKIGKTGKSVYVVVLSMKGVSV